MFPGVNGFHWSTEHLIFLGIFFSVVTVIGITLVVALLRSLLTARRGQADAIRWKEEFKELPGDARSCRHELNGQVEHRRCARGFDCRACTDHPHFGQIAGAEESDAYGLAYPANRFYHRGHTWVEPQADGTVNIGLDELGSRLIGNPDAAELPPPGARLHLNGPAWRLGKHGHEVRILSPVDGEVVETGGPDAGFYLRVKPDNQDFTHLLKGAEVRFWLARELERLQMAFSPEASLADGGELVHDVISGLPEEGWDALLGEVFLEP